MFAKEYSVSLTFDVLHEHDLGWSQDNKWLGGINFPHALEQSNAEQFSTSKTTMEAQTPTAEQRLTEITGES